MEKRQLVCIMPGKCMECGSVFDMSYEFSASVSGESFAEENALDLCWVCRDR